MISASHVVLVTAQAVSVYEFDSTADHPPEPATLESALCVLELPTRNPAPFPPYVRTYMQFPPSVPTPAQPPTDSGDPGVAFGLDRAQTVLIITLLLSVVDKHGIVGSDYRYVIFVPLSTLRVQIAVAAAHSGSGTDTDTDTGTDANAGQRTMTWEKWGPLGTRVVRFSYISHIFAMGSRCAIMRQEQGHSGELHVVLFDVRRGVPGETERTRLERMHEELFDSGDVLEPSASFAEEIRTTFPFEVVHRSYGSMLSGYLVQDAVVVSVSVVHFSSDVRLCSLRYRRARPG